MKISTTVFSVLFSIALLCVVDLVHADSISIQGHLYRESPLAQQLPDGGKWEKLLERATFTSSVTLYNSNCVAGMLTLAFAKLASRKWTVRIYKSVGLNKLRSISATRTLRFAKAGNLVSSSKLSYRSGSFKGTIKFDGFYESAESSGIDLYSQQTSCIQN